MGRYDNIKVFDSNGIWQTPERIRIYSKYNAQGVANWIDLGASTSYVTTPIRVQTEEGLRYATLDRKDVTVVTDKYAVGPFSVSPAAGYCFCPTSSSAGEYNFNFNCTVRKTSATDQRIFYSGNGYGDDFIDITWLANGKIRVQGAYNGNTKTFTSSNAVGINTWVNLRVYANKGSYKTYIVFNGVTTSTSFYVAFINKSVTNKIGTSYLHFKNTLTVTGVSYTKGALTASFNASTVSGTAGSYVGVTHKEDSRTDTFYITPSGSLDS